MLDIVWTIDDIKEENKFSRLTPTEIINQLRGTMAITADSAEVLERLKQTTRSLVSRRDFWW